MADVILSDGREITFDLSRISIGEYRALLKPVLSDADQLREDETVARVAGLTVEEYQSLPHPDWRRVVAGMFAKAREPLSDPS